MSDSAETVLHLPEKDKHGIVQTLCGRHVPGNEVRDDPRHATCKRCVQIHSTEEDRWLLAEEDHYGERL
jgi:hypothetical protein